MPTLVLLLQVVQVPLPPGTPGIPPEAIIIVKWFFATIVIIALGIPLLRALSRRFLERPAPAPMLPGDIITRLERIEQAVDAMSIEVERISENQRFATKLLTEARAATGALPGPAADTR